jgi:hypothetical protein
MLCCLSAREKSKPGLFTYASGFRGLHSLSAFPTATAVGSGHDTTWHLDRPKGGEQSGTRSINTLSPRVSKIILLLNYLVSSAKCGPPKRDMADADVPDPTNGHKRQEMAWVGQYPDALDCEDDVSLQLFSARAARRSTMGAAPSPSALAIRWFHPMTCPLLSQMWGTTGHGGVERGCTACYRLARTEYLAPPKFLVRDTCGRPHRLRTNPVAAAAPSRTRPWV